MLYAPNPIYYSLMRCKWYQLGVVISEEIMVCIMKRDTFCWFWAPVHTEELNKANFSDLRKSIFIYGIVFWGFSSSHHFLNIMVIIWRCKSTFLFFIFVQFQEFGIYNVHSKPNSGFVIYSIFLFIPYGWNRVTCTKYNKELTFVG